MSVINNIKLQTYNKDRKETSRGVANSFSQLYTQLNKAVIEQAYLRKNPDSLFDEDYVSSLSSEFDELKVTFTAISSLIVDMEKVKLGAMTVDELITKYSVDLSSYSNSLI